MHTLIPLLKKVNNPRKKLGKRHPLKVYDKFIDRLLAIEIIAHHYYILYDDTPLPDRGTMSFRLLEK